MRTGWLMMLALAAGGAQAQRYSSRPDPANPDAYDRYRARVTPTGAAAVVAGSAAAAAAGLTPRSTAPAGDWGKMERVKRLARASRAGDAPIAPGARALPPPAPSVPLGEADAAAVGMGQLYDTAPAVHGLPLLPPR